MKGELSVAKMMIYQEKKQGEKKKNSSTQENHMKVISVFLSVKGAFKPVCLLIVNLLGSAMPTATDLSLAPWTARHEQ